MVPEKEHKAYLPRIQRQLYTMILSTTLLSGMPTLSASLYAVVNQAVRAKSQSLNWVSAGADRHAQININRATVAELKALPGIGEATAQRIVDYRKKNPPFRRLEELLIIRGISRNRLEQIRHRIRLD